MLHPRDHKKAAAFVWLEVNIWEQMMLAELIYEALASVVMRFYWDEEKWMKRKEKIAYDVEAAKGKIKIAA